MSARGDRQVLPALIGSSAVHVILPRRTDHDIALIHNDAGAIEFDESLPGNTDDHLALVMAVRGSLSTCCNLHHADIQFIVCCRTLNPGEVQARSR